MRYAIPLTLVALAIGLILMQFHTSSASALDEAPATMRAPGPNEKQAMFSAGCFWGVEESFRRLKGVTGTEVGYCGGHTENPTYKAVCTDVTGYAETVLVTYDPAQISYAELLDTFWSIHNPTTKDSQGPDFGTQYRSIIFYQWG